MPTVAIVGFSSRGPRERGWYCWNECSTILLDHLLVSPCSLGGITPNLERSRYVWYLDP